MAGYYTTEHFKLLNKWKGQARDDTNPDQNRAYEELKEAYAITLEWAQALQARRFPEGRAEARRKPTNQARRFAAYQWARVYPDSAAPEALAYTVGIEAEVGFVVKIDTVGLDETSPVRRDFETIRGSFSNDSPITRILPIEEGLAKTFDQLIEWSIEAIDEFKVTYEQILDRLELPEAAETSFPHQETRIFDNGRWGVTVNPAPPKRRGHCMDVWVVGERRLEEQGRIPTLEDIRGDDRLARSNVSNVSQEFYRWRKWRNGEVGPVMEEASRVHTEGGHPRSGPSNVIYYGPPGTGKTYRLANLIRDLYQSPQPSMSIDDWRTKVISERIAPLTWWEGTAAALIDLGRKAKVGAIFDHPFIQAIITAKGRKRNVRQTLWGTLQHHALPDSSTVQSSARTPPAVFDKGPDSVWFLAGEWEEACADVLEIVNAYRNGPAAGDTVERFSFVTFHQSYGYEDFVEGLRPVLDGDGDGEGGIRYEIRSGVFKDLCRRARAAPDKRFAIIIDEINRGNISKIFGELITLIESDKREQGDNPVFVTLPYSGERFAVPSNVDVIGTMNTADRSLALLDTALRRRFDFVPVLPDVRDVPGAPLHGLRVNFGDAAIDIPRMLAAINERIEALYDRDHAIGHAYLVQLRAVTNGEARMRKLADIFRNRVLPLLEEYFFDDWQKIQLILADNQPHKQARFLVALRDQDDDLDRLFGGDHGLDRYATKRQYTVQDFAFMDPAAYIGIYSTLDD